MTFFSNTGGDTPWMRRGEDDARIRTLETRVVATRVGGAALADLPTTSASTWLQWGSSLVIPNPAVDIDLTFVFTGFAQDFTNVGFVQHRLSISFDAGSTWAYSPTNALIVGQGGLNFNRATVANSTVRSGIPTGSVHLRVEGNSNSTTTGLVSGVVTYTMMPRA